MSTAGSVATRKPWLAGLLSGLQPGLGQLYNGEIKKAIVLAVLVSIVVGPVLAGLMIAVPIPPPYNVLVPVFLAVAVLVMIVRDATRTARQYRNSYELKPSNKWYVYLSFMVLWSVVLQPMSAHLIRQWVQAFKIPAGSMVPTLLVGDHVLVDKSISWNGAALQRGEIIVFPFPEDETKTFIKRIVGLPGETIEVRNKAVYVNDRLLDESTYVQHIDPGVIDGTINPRDNVGPVMVPEEAYFVLGDNRDQSLDSRFWGYVQRSKVMGKLLFTYWSWDQEQMSVRWDRVGKGTE